VTVSKEEPDTLRKKNTLFHGETLLVVPARDTENIACPFSTKCVAIDFLRDPFVVEDTAAQQK
jgi:hypothetical protein